MTSGLDPLGWIALDRTSAVSLEAQLSRQLVMLIASGQLVPGDALPSLRALAERLDINQLTVRAAYRRIADQGLVRTEQGRGTVVISHGLEHLAADRRDLRSFTIGVLFPAFAPFYAPMLRGISSALGSDPSQILIGSTGDRPATTLVLLQQLVARDIDGVIAVSQNLEGFDRFDRTRLPPIVFGDWPDSPPPAVRFGLEGIGDAVRHLVDEGHRSVGFVTPGDNHPVAREMRRVFRDAAASAGLDPDAQAVVTVGSWLAPSAPADQAGIAVIDDTLTGPSAPSAVITASMELATATTQRLREAGRRVPDDMAVVSIGGHELAPIVSPAMSTVDLPAEEMGQRLMKILQGLLAGEDLEAHVESLPSTFTPRASCGPH